MPDLWDLPRAQSAAGLASCPKSQRPHSALVRPPVRGLNLGFGTWTQGVAVCKQESARIAEIEAFMRLGLRCEASGIGISGLTLADLSPVGQSVVRLNALDHVVCPYLSPSPNIRHYIADESLQ